MSTRVNLAYPIKTSTADGQVEEIVAFVDVRRPKVKDLRSAHRIAGDDEFELGLHLLASLTGLSSVQLGAMDAVDFAACEAQLSLFMRSSPPAATS